MLIVGAVHIAQPLSRMASVAGYDVTVIDPRASFATDERFPGISLNGEWPDDAMRELDPDRRTAVVTLTHDPKLDDPGLEVALKSDAFYIGSLGSRKTHAGRVERLSAAGFTETEIERIHAPVGLAIGSISPAEIAVSILAQITKFSIVRPKGGRLRDGSGLGGQMKFGDVALKDAENAILAHSMRLADGILPKGRVLDKDDIAQLAVAGISSVVAARLEDGDLNENEAALKIAKALQNKNLVASGGNTGRANLRAETAGVALIDAETVHRLNAVDEAVTVSTLRPYDAVSKGHVAATVKIITFGVSGDTVERCVAIAKENDPPVRVSPFGTPKIGFVQTLVPGLKKSLVSKASSATAARLSAMGLDIADERHCEHNEAAVAENLSALAAAGCDIVLVLGASAIVDRRDTVPAALVAAGGKIDHLGLPVDPGNLLLFAKLGDTRVLGIPGSARSPRLHGFDWVLQRLVAGLDVTPEDLTRMGSGEC